MRLDDTGRTETASTLPSRNPSRFGIANQREEGSLPFGGSGRFWSTYTAITARGRDTLGQYVVSAHPSAGSAGDRRGAALRKPKRHAAGALAERLTSS